MEVFITVDSAAGDDPRSLYTWLAAEEDLRGRIRLAAESPTRGTLGSAPDVLVAALGQGGTGVVLASALITWLRHRTGDVVCKFRRPDGITAEITAKRVHNADTVLIRQLVNDLSRSLEGDSAETEYSAPPPSCPNNGNT